MGRLVLTAPQEQLRIEIKSGLDRVHQLLTEAAEGNQEAVLGLIDRLATKAHSLHMSLKEAGAEPTHHGEMIRNRGLSPDDVHFYRHVHPIEDLLRFIDDPSNANDPSDQTLGGEFEFRVYSQRWGHEDLYRLVRTETGWDLRFASIGGACDPGGRPYLFENLEHDGISYPADLAEWFEWLWSQARDHGLSKPDVQNALDELARWIEIVEKNVPSGVVWTGFK